MQDKAAQQQVLIRVPASLELKPARDQAKRYDAVQRGNADAYDDEAWFDLRCQMENANYLQAAPPFWHDNAWRLRFKPAPRRADTMRRLQPLRRRWRKWIRPPEGSPRAYAPRFDGDFFGNWIRRLTALGVFSSIFAILVQTRVRLKELKAIDLAAWKAEPGAQRLLSLLTITEGLVICLLVAIAIDLAYYTARRLYRVTGLSVAGLPYSFPSCFTCVGRGSS
ncbi:hypothetical protein [Paracoccus shandongensis]|uniref:hypothetical protein n=1 Tax=Paracoccus shandongensis TaxID=2816048 RepID=UPI001A90CC05|nr:hypothetical protein [Paracoccus shandongensis]